MALTDCNKHGRVAIGVTKEYWFVVDNTYISSMRALVSQRYTYYLSLIKYFEKRIVMYTVTVTRYKSDERLRATLAPGLDNL